MVHVVGWSDTGEVAHAKSKLAELAGVLATRAKALATLFLVTYCLSKAEGSTICYQLH